MVVGVFVDLGIGGPSSALRFKRLEGSRQREERKGGRESEGICRYLCDSGPQERADQEFEALEFGLDDYERKVRFRIHVAGHFFYELDLLFRSQSVFLPL